MREVDSAHLHPVVRDGLLATAADLEAQGIPLRPFEYFRQPERQADLFAQGRSTEPALASKSIVTYAQPWYGAHCFGLAADFNAFVDGKWVFDDHPKWTAALREIGKKHGLLPIVNKKGHLIDPPHLQYMLWNQADCLAGRYPDGGDASWIENFDTAIARWGHAPRIVHGLSFRGSPPPARLP